MKKYEIEIDGLLERGWRPVAYRKVKHGESYLTPVGEIITLTSLREKGGIYLIVEKIKPRRILIEETTEVRKAKDKEWCETYEHSCIFQADGDTVGEYKIWREVKDGE